jgi:hypothetical protein
LWCRANDVSPATRTAFGRTLGALGFENYRGSVVTWFGLRLKPTE